MRSKERIERLHDFIEGKILRYKKIQVAQNRIDRAMAYKEALEWVLGKREQLACIMHACSMDRTCQ